MELEQEISLERSNEKLCKANKEQRERIANLERTNDAQRDALKVSHDVADVFSIFE